MKSKYYAIFTAVWFLGGIALIIFYLKFSDNPNYARVAQIAGVSLAFMISFGRSMFKESLNVQRVNEAAYQNEMGDAFHDNPKAYEQLMKGMEMYNRDNLAKADKILTKLLAQCQTPQEFSVVNFFRALCMSESELHEEAIEIYQELLEYDTDNTIAWSNLGVEYLELGKKKEAQQAFEQALTYGSRNAAAYSNLAVLYLRTGENEKASDHALQALEIDSNQMEAMSVAAAAFQMMGDQRNAEKYKKMYIANGGEQQELEEMLEDIHDIDEEKWSNF